MKPKNIIDVFESFLKTSSIFGDKSRLQSNYSPETINHRDEQIQQLASVLAPVLKSNKPSNIFIYGKTGTGKTLSVQYVLSNIQKIAKEKSIPLQTLYINCKLKKIADTEYRLVAQMVRELGKEVPITGLPTEEVYKIFFRLVDEKRQPLILVLDEIDQLVKKTGDEILYNLTRINSELKQSQISIVGISNDLMFTEWLDPRIKSSLSEEELVFPPYNALQIQDILNERAKKTFVEGAISQGVIEKCAALAAREHGDARRAIELLRVAGEIAERSGDQKLELKHIDLAEEKTEKDRIVDAVIVQPKQYLAVLYTTILMSGEKKQMAFTGEIYDVYKKICAKAKLRPLTQRRVSDIIAEFDMLGILSTKVISKGRYGRTREISLAINSTTTDKVRKLLETDFGFL